ncbi:DNA-processing protein DprA [Intrasporangium calvum]|uniref:DNA protecting protein DprA n=1 Tax=Intrasporangium calvum (strain ATCC 23552 / DSM 43043 / JCM 3097 / NBRC 12989 / NCIMB 10167 / NRRL B-3866 / 7 KIP) TaxID=710696 RepID=E6SF01_INTC7|nr:DNA-processing protein DprA [Intrasporangium calvum]ADU48790.1 DNA protecting protein DprA [Intrasporangium calvum DSM 43043]
MTEDRLARAALSRLVEPGDRLVHHLLVEHGPSATLDRVRRGHGKLARFAERVRRLDVDRDIATAAKVGARVVVPGDDEWPERLDDLPTPPWCLWVRGPADLAAVTRKSVAVVGSRVCTAYGEQLAADLAAGVAQRGWTVISGAAFGIDGAAHRGTLAVDGVTVAALASGIDRPYPSGHARLIERIAETGAVLSEVAPGSAPMRMRFLQRNRLIAAMSRGTVVVEADLRSGSLNTLGTAVDLGRPVGACPGPVTSMTSAGCHAKIRLGMATLVTTAVEVIDLVGELGEDACEEPRGAELATDGLDPDEAKVHDGLPHRAWADLGEVCNLSALAPMQAMAVLARLVELGLAERRDGSWRKAPPSRTGPTSARSASQARPRRGGGLNTRSEV